ncbi:hypothetical protein MUY27_13230 [Mucilaginibacter sp. RS28]|uniref:Uncharacterized protein n=1 Tax=Mucilaginibacter straminoryzae TaxID=2932774 RepID=A0A9X1X6P3_9SPHI|nr:hypothetical protein [Mucilaginibacter straminoryzae]MCJ8210673.1 hypothetical protein [Mucilaginibacter straminoryzae]
MVYYEGSVLFENLLGREKDKRKWLKNRDKAFFGSSQHYLRSILKGTNVTEGFQTYRLVKRPNPARLADSLINAKLKYFRKLANGSFLRMDSIKKWSDQQRMPRLVSYLYNTPLSMPDLVKRTDQQGVYALGFQDQLYVVYGKNKQVKAGEFKPDIAEAASATTVNLTAPYAFFDNNGVILNPAGVIFEGAWGKGRVAQTLPVDFEPNEKK